MDDNGIIKLYFERSEEALKETEKKYGRYCYSIAYNILEDREDSLEAVNDTYLGAWDSIPPNRPDPLSVFLGRITRNLSIDKWRSRMADKRGNGSVNAALEELDEALPYSESTEKAIETKELARIIDSFLLGLDREERSLFVRRYWYIDTVKDIARRFGYTESKVKMRLMRTRQKLKTHLEKEGIVI